MHRQCQQLLICLLLFGTSASWAKEDRNLPLLGDAASGIVSLTQERKLGQAFLRSLRAKVLTVSDPVLKDYLEYLIYLLAENSELSDRQLDLIILESRQLNAFAVPGGVVGINLGLFLHAETRSEFSAILSHELAHISQRHYARAVEASQQTSFISIAGLLASVVLIATGGTDAGLAAMTTSQGLAEQSALRNSRAREAEADRVGINTLVKAKMDPRAMAHMFERLNKINRYAGQRLPDFLLTHPVTQSRISDAYNQTSQYPEDNIPVDFDFQLMRVKVLDLDEQSPDISVKRMRDGLQTKDKTIRKAYQYGLALALTRASRLPEAHEAIDELLPEFPSHIALLLAKVAIHLQAEEFDEAQIILERHLAINPGNYPLSMAYATLLQKKKNHNLAVKVLKDQAAQRPNDPDVWYQLAEAYGLNGNIPQLHQARAEFFVLNGNLQQAMKQLEYALPLVKNSFQETARITQRLIEIQELRKEDL